MPKARQVFRQRAVRAIKVVENRLDTTRNAPVDCPVCGRKMERRARNRSGRQQRYCSRACLQSAYRGRAALRNGDPLSPIGLAASVTKCKKFGNEINELQTQKTDPGKASLYWVKVNECTWKLTDGSVSRTPASHGQWAGFNTERALAWVIDTGWVVGRASWYARCGDRSYGPTGCVDAKAVAPALVTGVPLEKDELAFAGAVDLTAITVLEPHTRPAEKPRAILSGVAP